MERSSMDAHSSALKTALLTLGPYYNLMRQPFGPAARGNEKEGVHDSFLGPTMRSNAKEGVRRTPSFA